MRTTLNMTISQKAIDEIIFFEVTSESYYTKKLQTPSFPGGASGVTIGIGYDLGYYTPAEIQAVWGKHLPKAKIDILCSVAGLKGSKALAALSKAKSVVVPFDIAKKVFMEDTLYTYAAQTKRAFPGVELLHADAQGALVSLVYNRGALVDDSDKRKEMKAIRDLVPHKDYHGIATQLRSMKRLWDKNTMGGLITRREEEAVLVETVNHTYLPSEIMHL